MKRLCIVHFHELEKYPPATNFIKYLSKNVDKETRIDVLTTRPANHSLIEMDGVTIHRFGTWREKMTKWDRALVYAKFNLFSLWFLLRKPAKAILYYETLSAGPAWMLKKIFKSKSQIFIHYHEYISIPEYEHGMVLNRWLHKREKALYPYAEWVSHTNVDRIKLFLRDLNGSKPSSTHTVPNYPPAWWKRNAKENGKEKIGFVYVGALSMDTMHLEKMAQFIMSRQQDCYWDIYSTNVSADAKQYLECLGGANIHFKGGVPYEELPAILSQYDIGLVLYKGHIPNYVYNVPNKLFEYHVCGLDVWFPDTMKSSLEFCTVGTFPRIVAIDFNQLDSIDLNKEVDHTLLRQHQQEFACEKVFEPLAQQMIRAGLAQQAIGNRQQAKQ